MSLTNDLEILMKTTQQKRDDRVKQMEGSRITYEYAFESCYMDDGDTMVAITDYMNIDFIKAVLMLQHRHDVYAVKCLRIAFLDIARKYASQFPSEEELKENDDD